MTTKHTKGEWFVQGKNLIKCGDEQIGSANSMIDEYEANANLIALAPELLEVLLKVQKDLEQCLVLPSTEKAIQEVIAKLNK